MYYVLGILAIGVMIIVHEVGHYIMARINGVKVLEFSIGFGPKIISHQGKETLFSIALLPIGGYVNMLGSMDDNDDKDIEPEPDDRYFKNKSPLQRFSIIIAGPLMNIILAIVLFSAFYTHFGFADTTLSQVQEQSSAQEIGLAAGDKITSINGGHVFTHDDISIEIGLSKGEAMNIEFERDGNLFEKSITPKYFKVEDIYTNLEFSDTTLSKLEQKAADATGLQIGDKIVSINGEKVQTTQDIESKMKTSKDGIIKVELERGGKIVEKSFGSSYYKPSDVKVEDDKTKENKEQGKYMLGVVFNFVDNPSFIDGFKHSLNQTATIVTNNYKVISNLVQGKGNLKTDVGGPVAIMQISSSAAKAGIWNLTYLIAVMSAGLGIVNLLPLPVLDGGNCILILIELITRRKVPDKIVGVLNTIGIVLLFGIMILVTVKDILFPMNF